MHAYIQSDGFIVLELRRESLSRSQQRPEICADVTRPTTPHSIDGEFQIRLAADETIVSDANKHVNLYFIRTYTLSSSMLQQYPAH